MIAAEFRPFWNWREDAKGNGVLIFGLDVGLEPVGVMVIDRTLAGTSQ